jgi:SAM-dependent methyltransferase
MKKPTKENLTEVVKARAMNYDHHYQTAGWKVECWTKEKAENFLAYALEVNKGGNLNGKEITYALNILGVPQLHGMKILDYCCGTGISAIYFALCGAEVWAFDASSKAINIAEKSADMSGVSKMVHFNVLDAQKLPYESDFFNVSFCQSALHIVIDYPACPNELSRVLKSGGKAIFCDEGLGYNPFLKPIRWLRRRKWLKCGGRPLKYPDIEQFGKPFSKTDIQHFNILSQLKTAFRGQLYRNGGLKKWSRTLIRSAETIDAALLLKIPRLRKYCGSVVITYTK